MRDKILLRSLEAVTTMLSWKIISYTPNFKAKWNLGNCSVHGFQNLLFTVTTVLETESKMDLEK